MKFHQLLVGAAIFLTACSAPKYVYHFDHYDYNSGKKIDKAISGTIIESPLIIDREEAVVASLNDRPVVDNDTKVEAPSAIKEVQRRYKAMSKSERKEFRKELKKEIKNAAANKKNDGVASVQATQVFDTLVSLAIVFGGAGIVLIMLASVSNALWILGAISLVIGAFFFVKWVSNGNG